MHYGFAKPLPKGMTPATCSKCGERPIHPSFGICAVCFFTPVGGK